MGLVVLGFGGQLRQCNDGQVYFVFMGYFGGIVGLQVVLSKNIVKGVKGEEEKECVFYFERIQCEKLSD